MRAIGYRQPLDLQINYDSKAPEWNTYGFAPAVWSAGGDLIDRNGYRQVLGFPERRPGDEGADRHPGLGQVRLRESQPQRYWPSRRARRRSRGSGTGCSTRTRKAFPGDVQIVPLPRFGPHDVTDMGSWQWGITANATNGDAAWRFISFLLRPPGPADDSRQRRGTGHVQRHPADRRGSRPGGPEHLYVEQLEDGVARPRPQTAAYPALTAAFAKAFQKIVVGLKPVKPTLDAAARSVTADLIAHGYYANTGR